MGQRTMCANLSSREGKVGVQRQQISKPSGQPFGPNRAALLPATGVHQSRLELLAKQSRCAGDGSALIIGSGVAGPRSYCAAQDPCRGGKRERERWKAKETGACNEINRLEEGEMQQGVRDSGFLLPQLQGKRRAGCLFGSDL